MATALAPQPTFVPVDLVRFAFWFAYLAAVVAGISYGISAVGSLFGASWLGFVPATAAALLVVYSFVGRLRPTVS